MSALLLYILKTILVNSRLNDKSDSKGKKLLSMANFCVPICFFVVDMQTNIDKT